MRQWRRWVTNRLTGHSSDCGSASLEFITVGLILLVPLVYLVLTMAAIQSAAFAVEGGARQAVRVFVQAESESQAAARAERAIRFALDDAGLDTLEPHVSVSCSPKPNACLTRLGTVTISVTVTVPLPLTPQVLSIDVPLGVPLHATATEKVSRFWGAG
ncbi:MAG: hypothetical protein IT190_00555 [Microbacteriaceae bacterium]|nr:hypothetical protein [Microbacteriaceae bacterium]